MPKLRKRRNKSCKKVNPRAKGCKHKRGTFERKVSGPSQYIIYCIVNTGIYMNKGNLAASVARGFLGLYNKVDRNKAKSGALDDWEDTGERLAVLDGVNQKHLRHLAKDLRYTAVETHTLVKRYGHSEIILVLSTLGKEEYLEETLDGLTYLR